MKKHQQNDGQRWFHVCVYECLFGLMSNKSHLPPIIFELSLILRWFWTSTSWPFLMMCDSNFDGHVCNPFSGRQKNDGNNTDLFASKMVVPILLILLFSIKLFDHLIVVGSVVFAQSTNPSAWVGITPSFVNLPTTFDFNESDPCGIFLFGITFLTVDFKSTMSFR